MAEQRTTGTSYPRLNTPQRLKMAAEDGERISLEPMAQQASVDGPEIGGKAKVTIPQVAWSEAGKRAMEARFYFWAKKKQWCGCGD